MSLESNAATFYLEMVYWYVTPKLRSETASSERRVANEDTITIAWSSIKLIKACELFAYMMKSDVGVALR